MNFHIFMLINKDFHAISRNNYVLDFVYKKKYNFTNERNAFLVLMPAADKFIGEKHYWREKR